MNEQSILANAEFITTIKKENLLSLVIFFSDTPWLQQIAVEITIQDAPQYTFRVNKHFKRLRIIGGELNAVELFLNSNEQIEQFLFLCQNISVIEKFQHLDDAQQALVFFNHLFLMELNRYTYEDCSERFFENFSLLSNILTPPPPLLSVKQQQEIQDNLNGLKKLIILPRTETLQIISLLEARNSMVSSDQKISILKFISDLPLPSNFIESESKEVLAKAYLDCLELFDKATQTAYIYSSKAPEDEVLKKQVLDLFVSFVTKSFTRDDEFVIVDEYEEIFKALSLPPENLWKALLKNHPDIEQWLIPSKAWRSARETDGLEFSFFYQDGILVLFSYDQLEPHIINLLPEKPLSKKIFNFLLRVDDINLYHETLFEELAKCTSSNVNENFQLLFDALFFGEELNLETNAQNFLDLLDLLTDPNIKNASILPHKASSNEKITSHPPANFHILKTELFRIEYFFHLANLIYFREEYEPLLDKIRRLETEKIKITVTMGVNQTKVCFFALEEEIGTLTYASALAGMTSAFETLETLPSDVLQKSLAIFRQSVVIMKRFDIAGYLNIKMITAFALKGEGDNSLYRNISSILQEWENNKDTIIERFVSEIMCDEFLWNRLDFDTFSDLDAEKKLHYIYQLVLDAVTEETVNKDSNNNKKLISQHKNTLFQPSFDHKISLSKNQLETICCLLPESFWKLLLKSLHQGAYPIETKTPPLHIDRDEDGYLKFASNEKMVLRIKNLCDGLLSDENRVVLIKRALDLLMAAKSFPNPEHLKLNATTLNLEALIQKIINTPQDVSFPEIEEIGFLSNELFDCLKTECYEQWKNIVIYHPLGMDGFFAFLASRETQWINSQFKLVQVPYSVEKWCSTIINFINSPILKIKELEDWQNLMPYYEQIDQMKEQPNACLNFNNALTIWSLHNPDCISVIELEEPTKLEGIYLKFCKQACYYANTSPHFIQALLEIHDSPYLTSSEKLDAFELFLKRQVKSDHPLLSRIVLGYEYETKHLINLN